MREKGGFTTPGFMARQTLLRRCGRVGPHYWRYWRLGPSVLNAACPATSALGGAGGPAWERSERDPDDWRAVRSPYDV